MKDKDNSYKNFELKRVVDLPEIHCILKELEHRPTGAKVMHLYADDPENVFCLSFQTTPENSNGVAHVLEHTVLCGSEKYPVKDPFFAMTRRSLNTFMNAFTGADFTCYPAASQLPKDFYNLLEVYLDAVFKPNLKKLSFLQEGHRLEFENPNDPATPLQLKGIVFNEMKGALASGESRLSESVDQTLYPTITYGNNSGGDPKDIPSLTYEELLEFHKKHYHPSRCLFFFYGNLPLEQHLDFIETHALKDVEKKPPLPQIPQEKRYQHPVKKTISYPYPEGDVSHDRCLIGMAWLTCSLLDQKTTLALSVLCTALLGTDAAPLKKALLKSKLCKQISANLIDEYSEIPVYLILKGCEEQNADKIETVIKETLEKIVHYGLSKDLIENALHQIEFHRSEIQSDSYPYGINLFMRAGLLMQHGGKPEHALLIHSLSEALQNEQKENPKFYESLIKKYFLDNTHAVLVVAKPDPTLEKREQEEENAVLEALQKTLDSEKEEAIVEQAKILAEFQEDQEEVDIDILPKITLADVPKNAVNYSLKLDHAKNTKVYHHDCFTNKILYADLIFPLPKIEEKELSLLKLTTLLIPQMGCGGRSYDENLQYIQAHTGGIAVSETLNIQVDDANRFDPYLVIHGKALKRNADKLLRLFCDMATSVDFSDHARLKEVLTKHFSGLQNSLNQNALRYAMNLAASGLGVAFRIGMAWGGLEYYDFVKTIIEQIDDNIESLAKDLQALTKRLFSSESRDLVLTCDQEMYQELKTEAFYGICDLHATSYAPWKANYSVEKVPSQGRIIASPVAFSAKAFPSVSYTHPDTPALSVAANLLDTLVLHPKIREQGGAYGSGATNQSLAGYFYFYAYRDPHIASSFEAFEESLNKIVEGDFKTSDLEEAIFEIVQDLDAPVSPGARGHVAYTRLREGKTLERRQAYRDKLLSLSKEDIIRAVQTHLIPNQSEGCSVVFAGKEILERENKIFVAKGKKPLEIKKV